MSSQLVWEVIRKSNSFLRTNLPGTKVLSAEPGNLYNLHSYKYSGLANSKVVAVGVKDGAITVSKKRTKTAQQPKKAQSVQVNKRNARRALSSVAKEVAGYRPDLKSAALARASALQKSLRVIKAKK